MSISAIKEEMWPEIIQLQSEAYFKIEPESEVILKSKWKNSPDTCFVSILENKVVAYMLAHGWAGEELPKLNQLSLCSGHNDYLFIHDLVVSEDCAGLGIGSSMARHVLDIAVSKGFERISLIAVQESAEFWQKMGFTLDISKCVSSTYGSKAVAMWRGTNA